MSWAEVSHETVLDRYGGVNSDRRDRDDANEERKSGRRGGGKMEQTDGKLISGVKRNAPVMLHRY